MRNEEDSVPAMWFQVLWLNLQKREKKHAEDEGWLEDMGDGVIEITLAVFWNDGPEDII